jgi:hypothetical protein
MNLFTAMYCESEICGTILRITCSVGTRTYPCLLPGHLDLVSHFSDLVPKIIGAPSAPSFSWCLYMCARRDALVKFF